MFIEVYFIVDIFKKFSFQGSLHDVDVKFLNMQSKMINSRLFSFSNENPSYQGKKSTILSTEIREHAVNALFLYHFPHVV